MIAIRKPAHEFSPEIWLGFSIDRENAYRRLLPVICWASNRVYTQSLWKVCEFEIIWNWFEINATNLIRLSEEARTLKGWKPGSRLGNHSVAWRGVALQFKQTQFCATRPSPVVTALLTLLAMLIWHTADWLSSSNVTTSHRMASLNEQNCFSDRRLLFK